MLSVRGFFGEERILAGPGLRRPKVFGRGRENTAMSQKHLSLRIQSGEGMAGKVSTK